MRLFNFDRAPNPRRVRIFLAEKGIEVPMVTVNLFAHEQLSPEFLAINSGGTVPVLETDDGTYLAESIAICHYIETLHPEPPLFGVGGLEQAQVLMWTNIVENEGISAVAEVLRNWSPGFRGRALPGKAGLEQIPALIERGRIRCQSFFDRVELQLASRAWLAGERFSIADITLLATMDFVGWIEIDPTQGRPNLQAWLQKRPLAQALAPDFAV